MTEDDNVALIDLDGTLADFDDTMHEQLKRLLSPGERLPHDIHKSREPWLENRMDLIMRQPGFWENLPIIPSGFRVYRLLCELGYRPAVLTRGPGTKPLAWAEKVRWCQKHLPEVDITIVTRKKSLVYGKVLFDDYPPYIESWLEHRPRSKVLMLETQYNSGFMHPQVLRIARQPGAHIQMDVRAAETIAAFLDRPNG